VPPSARAATFLLYTAANTRRLRALRRMTQERLAENAGIDLTFLQRVEAAKTNLSIGVLVAIADALGVHPRILLGAARLAPPKRGRPRR
jgi:transcriptional regulator with XRE-family HTH domain